jgi:hypothetical protein
MGQEPSVVIQPILRPKLLQRGTISGANKISGSKWHALCADAERRLMNLDG